jgi:two-component system phosphate regulon response regulator PhoB
MRKLLLVEDSPTQAAVLRTRFEESGLTVAVTHTGEEALELVHSFRPDLVVLDLQLPGISGIEVCRRLKLNSELRITPVLIFSATDALKFMVDAYDAGADYYVVKDENGERVLELLVESVLLRRNRLRFNMPIMPRAWVA